MLLCFLYILSIYQDLEAPQAYFCSPKALISVNPTKQKAMRLLVRTICPC